MVQGLFTASATRRFRSLLVGTACLAVGLPTLLMYLVRTPEATGMHEVVDQPLPFDHRHHVLDAGLDCAFCHRHAGSQAHAGMPSTDLCMRCHVQVLADAPTLRPLRQAHEEGRSIRWKRVNEVFDVTYFHHGVHVQAGVDCRVCHGEVERMGAVHQARPLTMGWCIDCHRRPERYGVDADPGPTHCSACHR